MAFIRDVTIGEGESVPPNTTFVKTWRIQNNGKNLELQINILFCDLYMQLKGARSLNFSQGIKKLKI